MNLVERVERLEKLIGVGVPADTQAIDRLMECAKMDAAILQSLLYNLNRMTWLAELDWSDFQTLWSGVLPAIFREAKSRGYLQMDDLDILHWDIYHPIRVEIHFADEVWKGECE